MTNEDKKNKILLKWKVMKGLQDTTLRSYQNTIRHFSEATGLNLVELEAEAIFEEETHVPLYRRKYTEHMVRFQQYLEEKGFHESTRNKHLNVINSFYDSLGVTRQRIKNPYKKTPDPDNTQKVLPKELIRVMISNANIRDKAILSTLATTGQAQNEIRHMTIKQLMMAFNTVFVDDPFFDVDDIFSRKDDIMGEECYRLDVYRSKVKSYYYTYIPRESISHIWAYLYEREHGSNENLRIRSINDYLFMTKYGGQMGATAIGKVCTNVGTRCGFEDPSELSPKLRSLLQRDEGKHRIWKSHNFRKYFLNTCKLHAGTPSSMNVVITGSEFGDFWIGHKPRGSIKSYIQEVAGEEDLMKKQYLQVLPYLSVETDVRVFDDEDKVEFEQLKESYLELEREMEALKEYVKFKQLRRSFD